MRIKCPLIVILKALFFLFITCSPVIGDVDCSDPSNHLVADQNKDGDIDGHDLALIAQVFGSTFDVECLSVAAAYFGSVNLATDEDNDGIPDNLDLCSNTPAGETVDRNGCSASQRDTDNDGTPDDLDLCPNDPSKIEPGHCECGIIEFDVNNDGIDECTAGEIIIITSTDDGLASDTLRQAIVDANSNDVLDMIILQDSAAYMLTVPGRNEDGCAEGDLDITTDLIILGTHATIDASGLDRVLHIHSGASVSIWDLELRGGHTATENGGGIYVEGNGSLLMANCSVTNNSTGPQNNWNTWRGGYGGGIFIDTNGSLDLEACIVSDNQTGSGPADVWGGGHGGHGGGIAAIDAVLSIDKSNIVNNRTGDGNNQVYGDGYGGNGGGLYIAGGSAVITESTLVNNTTGSGYSNTSNPVADSGYGGEGGGLYLIDGMLVLDRCSISANRTGSGNDGGNSGSGGGLYLDLEISDTTTIRNVTIDNNRTGYASYHSGFGGGIYYVGGPLEVYNSTISGNSTGYGYRAGSGGGIYQYSGDLTIDSSTICFNSVGNSSVIDASDSCRDLYATYGGGGIFAYYGEVVFKNAIIAKNTVEVTAGCGADGRHVDATVTSNGFNLIGNDTWWYFSREASDLIGTNSAPVDPGLDALGDNGGPTQTHALLNGSPAVDTGECLDSRNDPILYDQRGFDRNDGSCDMGSFEQ
jgi:hypothetical protein